MHPAPLAALATMAAALAPNQRQASLSEPSHLASVSATIDEVEEQRGRKSSMAIPDKKYLWALQDSYLDRRGSVVRSYHKLDRIPTASHDTAVLPDAVGSYASWFQLLAQRALAWLTLSLERYTSVRL